LRTRCKPLQAQATARFGSRRFIKLSQMRKAAENTRYFRYFVSFEIC